MLAGQFVAMVLANSPIMAEQAAALVKVEYSAADPQHSHSYVDRRTASDSDKIVPSTDSSKALARNAGGASTVSGSIAHCQQKHFYMETQTTLAIPSDDGAFGYVSTAACVVGRAGRSNLQHL
jgi:xanthine dehydrogenase molybdopterin-binding subunit B